MTGQQESDVFALRSYLPNVSIALLTALFVYFLVFKFPFTPILIEADHHIFLYEGMRLFGGEVMYRDFFQFTFPGSQAYYWLMLSLFGLHYYVLGFTIIGIAVASVLVCISISRSLIPSRSYILPALVFVFFGFRWLGLDGAHRMFSPIFVMLAVWFVLRYSHRVGVMLAGSACAFASFFTQQRGFITVFAILIFLLLDASMRREKWRHATVRIGVFITSFAIVLALLCFYFIIQAGWESFYQATFVYPAKYYRYSHHNDLTAIAVDLNAALKDLGLSKAPYLSSVLFYLFVIPAAHLVFWGIFIRNRKRDTWEAWRNITLVALVGTSLTVFNLNSPSLVRMFQTALPGLIVFFWLLHYAKERFSLGTTYFAPAAMCILILFGGIQAIRIQSASYEAIGTPSGTLAYYPNAFIENRYGWLVERTRPGDYVFEVYVPYVYFPLHLKNPTAYGQIWDTDYTRPEHVAHSIEQLRRNPPRYVLWDNHYNKSAEQRAPGDHLEPLYQYLLAHYRPTEARVDIVERRIQIWERK